MPLRSRLRAALLLAAAFVLSVLPVGAQASAAPQPAAETATPSALTPAALREVVDTVAQRIQDHYYDLGRGRELADALRGENRRGAFDSYRDPRDLASALSERLKPHDGHFRVVWRAPTTAAGTATAGAGPRLRRGPDAGAIDYARRRNHGLRRVELLPGNLGYVDLREFAEIDFDDPLAPARRALDAALAFVADCDALIVDLRDNGGGAPSAVGYLASAFVTPGADVYNRFRWRDGDTVRSSSEAPKIAYPAPRTELPLYVLTSSRTASAAEAFTYTLRNVDRAVVVGETSTGAANPGGERDAGAGFSVFVADGSPVSPITGGNWEGRGVVPDVPVPQHGALRTAQILALEAVLARGLPGANADDARWALEALRAAQSKAQADAYDPSYLGDYGRIRIERDRERLALRNGKRPLQPLTRLQADLYCLGDDPSVRVRFERDGAGRIAALQLQRPDGSAQRYAR
ncbi:S41 family peptidase [Lysobacter firmicutimachus]|uniref:S41 family peptidase n=1 Tax=Lysobacter firmicutimachus TaxID=1792846 RepID=A0AAU8MQC6_9GAMM